MPVAVARKKSTGVRLSEVVAAGSGIKGKQSDAGAKVIDLKTALQRKLAEGKLQAPGSAKKAALLGVLKKRNKASPGDCGGGDSDCSCSSCDCYCRGDPNDCGCSCGPC